MGADLRSPFGVSEDRPATFDDDGAPSGNEELARKVQKRKNSAEKRAGKPGRELKSPGQFLNTSSTIDTEVDAFDRE
jgi:hypothetical protein